MTALVFKTSKGSVSVPIEGILPEALVAHCSARMYPRLVDVESKTLR